VREDLTDPRLAPWATRLRPSADGLTYSTRFWNTTPAASSSNSHQEPQTSKPEVCAYCS